MRFWKSATLGLGVAAVLAACGGTPAAPGGTPGAGGPAGPGGDPAATPMRTVVVSQDSESQAYPLEGGRYRLAWTSTDCPDGIDIVVTQVDSLPGQGPQGTPYAYQKTTNIPAFNTLLQRVPPGLYTVEQAVESCAEWELRADRVGN